MARISLLRLISVLALAASALSASTITYEVGTCMPGLPSFPTITAALAATPAANVVIVCPGTYREQLQITQPVTLQGVSSDDSARAIIAPPPGGLVSNATADFGFPVAAQIWIDNASGPVEISDLTVDAFRNAVPLGTFLVGIFYQNSRGTVNRVATRNQSGTANGVGIYAQGGSSNPLVRIENSSVHDFDHTGIFVETDFPTPELTAVIEGNEITTSSRVGDGIDVISGTAATVRGNIIVDPIDSAADGIFVGASTGSVSGNTLVHGSTGIFTETDGVSVTSNKIFGTVIGISMSGVSVAAIHSNSITNSRTGIDFLCFADPNVHSNIITDARKALDNVPSAVATSNTYFNVDTIRNGSCP